MSTNLDKKERKFFFLENFYKLSKIKNGNEGERNE